MSKPNTVDSLSFDDAVLYHKEHTWVRFDGDTVVIGISDFAQDQLGEVIFVELPGVGDEFGQGDEFGVVESAKSTSELFMPMSGEVLAINEALEDSPQLVNSSPYENGWLIKIKPRSVEEKGQLMNHRGYIDFLKNQ